MAHAHRARPGHGGLATTGAHGSPPGADKCEIATRQDIGAYGVLRLQRQLNIASASLCFGELRAHHSMYVLCQRRTQAGGRLLLSGADYCAATLHSQRRETSEWAQAGEESAYATLSTMADTQGLRWVLIKKRIIISGEPTEIDEAVLNGDLCNSGLYRVAVSQGFVHHA